MKGRNDFIFKNGHVSTEHYDFNTDNKVDVEISLAIKTEKQYDEFCQQLHDLIAKYESRD